MLRDSCLLVHFSSLFLLIVNYDSRGLSEIHKLVILLVISDLLLSVNFLGLLKWENRLIFYNWHTYIAHYREYQRYASLYV